MGVTRLFLTATVDEQWRAVVEPWLRKQAVEAWRHSRPTVVLTPSRAEGFYLRDRLLTEGISILGVHFWTPSDARKFLSGALSPQVDLLTQPEQELLARACAEKLATGQKTTDSTLTSVMRDPEAFLRAYDLLLGAGSDPAREGAPYGRKLAAAFARDLKQQKRAIQAGLHRELFRLSVAAPRSHLAHLLLAGFNATHWPLWDLLKALVATSEQAVVSLLNPRAFGGTLDSLWIGSWEEHTGSSAEWPAANNPVEDTPFGKLAESYEGGGEKDLSRIPITFLAGADFTAQTRALVLQVLRYLASDSCTRLGLVFPEANGQARAVADELRRMGISLDDGPGSIKPGPFEQRFCQAWIAFQEEPSVRTFLYWVRACEADHMSFGQEEGSLQASDVAYILDAALGETLIDHLDLLARHLEGGSNRSRQNAVVDLLRHRVELPAEASFESYLALTRQTFTRFGWKKILEEVTANPWLEKWETVISRRIFLAWLRKAGDSRARVRDKEGSHFYGKVHLVIYAQMTGQTWSHLILTGLNEGVWPRFHEAGAFGSRHELALLNAQARRENRLVQGEGSQGAGHDSVQTNRGYCLLPSDRQELALRDLCSVIESTTEGLCLAAMTNEAGRSLLPSDFFVHAYQSSTGRVLDDVEYRRLAESTFAWGRRQETFLSKEAITDEDSAAEATRLARSARLDPTMPFGRYEFSYAERPPAPVQLSCKAWETAWNYPALIWLSGVVGVAGWPEGELAWPRAIGTWVHGWMMQALRHVAAAHQVSDFMSQLRAAADREAETMQSHALSIGIELVPWWGQVHRQARAIALQLGETLSPFLREPFFSEYRLPRDLLIALPGDDRADFLLRGRLDLVLIEPGSLATPRVADEFKDDICWVIDFKAGSAKALGEKEVLKGRGLQTILYALALRERGAASTALSLLSVGEPLGKQIDLAKVLEMKSTFRSLDQFHRRGIFGMRPGVESNYGYNPSYPIATRPVPQEVLSAKWALVHGEADADEEASE